MQAKESMTRTKEVPMHILSAAVVAVREMETKGRPAGDVAGGVSRQRQHRIDARQQRLTGVDPKVV